MDIEEGGNHGYEGIENKIKSIVKFYKSTYKLSIKDFFPYQ